MSSVTDVVPAVFTRTPCVMNLITLPAPACLLWMALVIYRGEPRAISHLYVRVYCVSVCWGGAVGGAFICPSGLHGRQHSKSCSHIITEQKKWKCCTGSTHNYTDKHTWTVNYKCGSHAFQLAAFDSYRDIWCVRWQSTKQQSFKKTKFCLTSRICQ